MRRCLQFSQHIQANTYTKSIDNTLYSTILCSICVYLFSVYVDGRADQLTLPIVNHFCAFLFLSSSSIRRLVARVYVWFSIDFPSDRLTRLIFFSRAREMNACLFALSSLSFLFNRKTRFIFHQKWHFATLLRNVIDFLSMTITFDGATYDLFSAFNMNWPR